jgi:hypothetical protein
MAMNALFQSARNSLLIRKGRFHGGEEVYVPAEIGRKAQENQHMTHPTKRRNSISYDRK